MHGDTPQCQVSQFDLVPLWSDAPDCPRDASHLIELGQGDGSFVILLCEFHAAQAANNLVLIMKQPALGENECAAGRWVIHEDPLWSSPCREPRAGKLLIAHTVYPLCATHINYLQVRGLISYRPLRE